jgi:hypothetical protein
MGFQRRKNLARIVSHLPEQKRETKRVLLPSGYTKLLKNRFAKEAAGKWGMPSGGFYGILNSREPGEY